MSNINNYLEDIKDMLENLLPHHRWFKKVQAVENFEMDGTYISINRNECGVDVVVSVMNEDSEVMEHRITLAIYRSYSSDEVTVRVTSMNLQSINCSSERDFNHILSMRLELAYEALQEFADKTL